MSASPDQNALVRRGRTGGVGAVTGDSMAEAVPDDVPRSAGAESWVCGCIEQISEKTSEGYDDSAQDHGPGDQVVVAGGNRVGGDVSHARPAEHLLHEEGSANESG